jgi:hypothetical protein
MLQPDWATNSRGPTSWWPSEGHEDAYRMGWETAAHDEHQKESA